MRYCYGCGTGYTEDMCPKCAMTLYTDEPNSQTKKNMKTERKIKMKKIQISFAGYANLEKVEEQLVELSNMKDIEFLCCFLNRKMVEEKGFTTTIVDLLEKTVGDRLTWLADNYKDFDDFMENIDTARLELSKQIDHIYVLDSNTAKGVAKEIALFTAGKVMLC